MAIEPQNVSIKAYRQRLGCLQYRWRLLIVNPANAMLPLSGLWKK